MFRPGKGGVILVRTAGPATPVVQPVKQAVMRVDRRLAATTTVLADGIAEELQAGRAMMLVAAGLGGLALLVALAGVGATAAQSVAQRTHEIGVRMALGARRLDAVLLIVRRTLTPVAVGATVGLLIASQASRVLITRLYGLNPLDAVAFTGSAAVVIVAATAAAWLPARRAASIDPIRTLRTE